MICNITTQEAERLSYISGDTATARALGVVDDAERKMIDADADFDPDTRWNYNPLLWTANARV